MYIIELFIKWLNKNKRGSSVNPNRIYRGNTNKLDFEREDAADITACNHNFMPLDSTGEILACTICGFVVKKNKKDN